MTVKEVIHRLVDEIPDSELHTALRFLEYVRDKGERLLTLDGAARYMSDPALEVETTPEDVLRYIEHHGLPARKIGGQWYVREEDLDDYVTPEEEATLAASENETGIPLEQFIREQLHERPD